MTRFPRFKNHGEDDFNRMNRFAMHAETVLNSHPRQYMLEHELDRLYSFYLAEMLYKKHYWNFPVIIVGREEFAATTLAHEYILTVPESAQPKRITLNRFVEND